MSKNDSQIIGSITSKGVNAPETQTRVLPKLMFDGSNMAQFHRDFPSIASFYGFDDLLIVKPGSSLSDEDSQKEKVARGIFRNHITKSVDKQITMTVDDDMMTLLETLNAMFFHLDVDARAAAQVQLYSTQMRAGEHIQLSLVV